MACTGSRRQNSSRTKWPNRKPNRSTCRKAPQPVNPKKKKDEEDLSFKKKKKTGETPRKKQNPKVLRSQTTGCKGTRKPRRLLKQRKVTKIEAPELEGPKVLDKIDLEAIDSIYPTEETTKRPGRRKKPEADTVQTEKAKSEEESGRTRSGCRNAGKLAACCRTCP